MKAFNGRTAAEDYMSTHSLTFSTPDLTLKKFVLWLGEPVSSRDGKEQLPRIMLYLEEKAGKKDSDLMPDTDDSFRPSGAVTEMYGASSAKTEDMTPPTLTPLNRETLEPEARFCIECGNKLKQGSKFCTKCGSKQA